MQIILYVGLSGAAVAHAQLHLPSVEEDPGVLKWLWNVQGKSSTSLREIARCAFSIVW